MGVRLASALHHHWNRGRCCPLLAVSVNWRLGRRALTWGCFHCPQNTFGCGWTDLGPLWLGNLKNVCEVNKNGMGRRCWSASLCARQRTFWSQMRIFLKAQCRSTLPDYQGSLGMYVVSLCQTILQGAAKEGLASPHRIPGREKKTCSGLLAFLKTNYNRHGRC